MHILKSTVGRKILMSVSGQLLIIFVLAHLVGNTTIFWGPNGVNAYAQHLHEFAPVVWAMRTVMLLAVLTHVVYGVQVTLENKAAKPMGYAVKRHLKATFASQTMIWTGLLLAAFILGHLVQFTFKATPDVVVAQDALGRLDVYGMVVTSFRQVGIALLYAVAMVMLFFHLSHGIPSFLQTMGWNNSNTLPVFGRVGKGVAAVLMIGYVAIPVAILVGALTL